MLTVIWSSVQCVSRMKELLLRNWMYSSFPVTLQYMLRYINWDRSQQVFSHSKYSPLPCYRRRIFEIEILKPFIKRLALICTFKILLKYNVATYSTRVKDVSDVFNFVWFLVIFIGSGFYIVLGWYFFPLKLDNSIPKKTSCLSVTLRIPLFILLRTIH